VYPRVIGLLLVCSACSLQEPTIDQTVRIQSDRVTYTLPADVAFSLVNRSDRTLYVNTCVVSLERRVNKEWRAQDPLPQSGTDCPTGLVEWPAGDSASQVIRIGATVPAGTYRGTFTAIHQSPAGQEPSAHSSPIFELFER
jgi:hypothetical protein